MVTGSRIKERRIKLCMSADQLAEKIGKNRATIYRYEGDEIENFPLPVIEPLAKALQTTPAYLMGWTDDPSIPQEEKPASKDELSVVNMTDEEIEFISVFSRLNPENRKLLLANAKVYLQAQGDQHDPRE